MNRLKTNFDDIKVVEGDLDLSSCKIAIVASRFNEFIVDKLIKGCIETLVAHRIDYKNIELISVPGALEIPLAVQNVAKNRGVAGVVALGAVIRGATAHFDFVASESIKGLSKISLDYNMPIGNAILTTENIEQAIERAGSKAGNKGSEAALTVLNMISLLDKLNSNNNKYGEV